MKDKKHEPATFAQINAVYKQAKSNDICATQTGVEYVIKDLYDANDDRWAKHSAELRSQLNRALDQLRLVVESDACLPGRKRTIKKILKEHDSQTGGENEKN